jgi:hypothetical protein
MNAIRQTQKKYCSRALTAAILIGFALILAAQKPIAKGLIIGTFASILNFILIGETLPARILQSSKKKTFALSLGSILLRYALMAVPLVIAIKSEDYNLFAVAAGLFMVQVMILVDHISSLTFSTRQG